MTAEEQNDGSEAEAGQAGSDEAPVPALNRAQRRAQAHGKKSAQAQQPGGPGRFNAPGGPGFRGPGGVTRNRLPRTGHK